MGSSTITTVTGKRFDPLHPDAKQIDLLDISHALSLLCRGGGHVSQFHTVAQHCLECAEEAKARNCSARIQLACLLHDASEAYMGDLITPLKNQSPGYQKAENHLLDLIWTKYLGTPLSSEEESIVFEIDKDFLSYEFHKLMPHDIGDRYQNVLTRPQLKPEDPASVKEAYLKKAHDLMAQL